MTKFRSVFSKKSLTIAVCFLISSLFSFSFLLLPFLRPFDDENESPNRSRTLGRRVESTTVLLNFNFLLLFSSCPPLRICSGCSGCCSVQSLHSSHLAHLLVRLLLPSASSERCGAVWIEGIKPRSRGGVPFCINFIIIVFRVFLFSFRH